MKKNKYLVIFGTDWCQQCTQLKEFIQNNTSVVKNFNVDYYDHDSSPSNIDVEGYPTILLLEPYGETDKFIEIAKTTGFSESHFMEWLKYYD